MRQQTEVGEFLLDALLGRGVQRSTDFLDEQVGDSARAIDAVRSRRGRVSVVSVESARHNVEAPSGEAMTGPWRASGRRRAWICRS